MSSVVYFQLRIGLSGGKPIGIWGRSVHWPVVERGRRAAKWPQVLALSNKTNSSLMKQKGRIYAKDPGVCHSTQSWTQDQRYSRFVQGQGPTTEEDLSHVCASWVLRLQAALVTSCTLGVLPLPGSGSSCHVTSDAFSELIFHSKCTLLWKMLKILQFGVRNKY